MNFTECLFILYTIGVERLADPDLFTAIVQRYTEPLQLMAQNPDISIGVGLAVLTAAWWGGARMIRNRRIWTLRNRLARFSEHSTTVTTPDEFTSHEVGIGAMTVGQYAASAELREQVHHVVGRIEDTQRAQRETPEPADGSSRP